MLMNIRPYHTEDAEQVIDLWRACDLIVPPNDAYADIQNKIRVQPELFLVGCDENGRLMATVMAGYEGHRGWINYLAVSPPLRRKGLGRRMMATAEARLRAMGCPKINLQVRKSNTEVIAFYHRIGFRPDPVTSLGKRLD